MYDGVREARLVSSYLAIVSPPQPCTIPRVFGAIELAGWLFAVGNNNAMCVGARNICCQKPRGLDVKPT